MSEAPTDIHSDASPPPTLPARRRWQVGLRTLCLFVIAVAVWTTVFVNRKQSAVLEKRIAAMRPLAHELVIDDPTQTAVVKLDELWMGDHQWDLYLPEGKYRLCLATHGIGQKDIAPVVKSGLLRGGKHHIALEQTNRPEPNTEKPGARVTVRWDQSGQLNTDEPPGWETGSSSTSEGGYAISTQQSAGSPLILHRCQFLQMNAGSMPSGPVDGILLWIEPITSPNDNSPPAMPPSK